jgi:hypothetical protein
MIKIEEEFRAQSNFKEEGLGSPKKRKRPGDTARERVVTDENHARALAKPQATANNEAKALRSALTNAGDTLILNIRYPKSRTCKYWVKRPMFEGWLQGRAVGLVAVMGAASLAELEGEADASFILTVIATTGTT